jgi:hypothetical protein
MLVAARELMGKGLVEPSDYFKLKELNSKNAECLFDSDCAGAACPLGMLDCYNACVSGLCTPKVKETICDGLDSDGDGLTDNGCDRDGDRFVDVNRTCVGSFYSSGNVFSVDANIVSTVLSLKANWNMAAIPAFNVSAGDLFTDCNAFVWAWNPNNGVYTMVNGFLDPSVGYWIYSPKACNFDFNRAPYVVAHRLDLALNNNGWTIVPGFKGNLKNTLGLTSPVWTYDGSYAMIDNASSTQAVWISKNDKGKHPCTQKDYDDKDQSIQ